MRPLFVSMLALWLVMSPANAWHETGHKMTAEIAFNLLSPKQQQHVAAVLRVRTASLMSGTRSDQIEACLKIQRAFSVSEPLAIASGIASAKSSLNRGCASDADKAVALCWILHLTGDMHQPLHNVALFSRSYFPKGDRGGNDINVAWEDDTRNLHAVWDGFPTRIENIVPRVAASVQLGSDTVSMQSIEVWAEQHAKIAKQYVYTKSVKEQLLSGFAANTNPDIRLTADYLTSGRTIASAQVILAGRRIAALLEN